MSRARVFRTRYKPAWFEPCIQTLTIATICINLIQWRSKSWKQRSIDISAGLICLAIRRVKEPLLSLSLALAYTVWISLPGSINDLNLPNHSTFMRRLQILQPDNTEVAECKVCWDTEHRLAQLPCGHQCCTRCLQTMGNHLHTACPHCRTPLFSNHDRFLFIVSKASVSCAAVNATIFLLRVPVELTLSDYSGVAISFASLCGMVGYLIGVKWLIGNFGDTWWRGVAGTARGTDSDTPFAACCAFRTGASLLYQGISTTNRQLKYGF